MPDLSDVPVPTIDLELAFQIRMEFTERFRWPNPAGKRVVAPPSGGPVWGPLLNGRVLPFSGADYGQHVGANPHVSSFNAHYLLEAEDGTPIYFRNAGYKYQTNFGADGEPQFYFRCTPQLEAPLGSAHEWVNRAVFVGTGDSNVVWNADPNQYHLKSDGVDATTFTYYVVR